ncbi:MAG: hypothetical protein HY094_10090 [Candidatus Melainabacteria bacterium]|nr:hypothetical protein [Candidatus Melainabacteria bacterium]
MLKKSIAVAFLACALIYSISSVSAQQATPTPQDAPTITIFDDLTKDCCCDKKPDIYNKQYCSIKTKGECAKYNLSKLGGLKNKNNNSICPSYIIVSNNQP